MRDRLTVQEAAQFAAQLPMLIRGIFYEGWDPDRVPVKMDRREFVERVRQELRFEPPDDDVERLTRTVLAALSRFVTEGEFEDIKSALPKEIAVLVP